MVMLPVYLCILLAIIMCFMPMTAPTSSTTNVQPAQLPYSIEEVIPQNLDSGLEYSLYSEQENMANFDISTKEGCDIE